MSKLKIDFSIILILAVVVFGCGKEIKITPTDTSVAQKPVEQIMSTATDSSDTAQSTVLSVEEMSESDAATDSRDIDDLAKNAVNIDAPNSVSGDKNSGELVKGNKSTSCSTQWTRLSGVSNSITGAMSVAVDIACNGYITGGTSGNLDGQIATGTQDAFLIKYNWNGVKQWTKLEGISNKQTTGYSIVLDSFSNIYIAGTISQPVQTIVIKYNSSGVKQWAKIIGPSSGGYNTFGSGIAVDSSGNSYITGWTNANLNGQVNAGLRSAFVIKYNSSGVIQWTKFSGNGGTTEGRGIATDSSGNIYITGMAADYIAGNPGIPGTLDGQTLIAHGDVVFVIKYNSSGVKLWTRVLGVINNGISYSYTEGNGIAVDPYGNSYVTGFTNGNLGGQWLPASYGVFVIKYDSNGVNQWTRLSGVSGAYTDGRGITVDSLGNIYTAGWTGGNLDGQPKVGIIDAFVIKYNSNGIKQWTRLSGVSNAQTVANGITVLPPALTYPNGSTYYVTGYTFGNLGGQTLTGTYDAFLFEKNW